VAPPWGAVAADAALAPLACACIAICDIIGFPPIMAMFNGLRGGLLPLPVPNIVGLVMAIIAWSL